MKTRYILCVVGMCATAMLTLGCASTPQGERVERLVVQGSIMTLIEHADDRAAKAARVFEAVRQVKTLLLDDSVTVGLLRNALLKRVSEREPSEKLLALEVVNTLSDALEARLGSGVLSSSAIVSVNDVLGWASEAASVYVQNPVTS